MTSRRTISATNTPDSGRAAKADGATKRPSRAHLLYLEQRAESAHRALIVAKEQRLGATVIHRRERKWIMAVAKLAAAMPAKEAA